MNHKTILKLVVALFIISAVIGYLYINGEFKILSKCNVADFVILAGITYLSYLINGYQLYYLVKEQNGVKLSIADMSILPLSMSLFAYVIPANGGLLYSVFFLKKKYNIDTSQGFSIGVFSVYLSLVVSGIIGLLFACFSKMVISALFIISILLIFSPAIIHVMNLCFQKVELKNNFFIRFKTYINDIIRGSNVLIINKRVITVNLAITILQIIITFISYLWLVMILEINIQAASLMLIVLLLRISGLVRVLPGNLGLEELITGGIFGLAGLSAGTGMVIALLLRLCTFFLIIPLGIAHTVINSHLFKLKDLKQFLKNSYKTQ